MTLRSRVALLVGTIAGLAMLVGGFWSYAAVRDEQYTTVDRFLEQRGRPGDQFDQFDGFGQFDALEAFEAFEQLPEAPSGEVPPGPFEAFRRQVDEGVTFQVNGADGALVVASNPEIELDVPDAAEIGTLRTTEIDGERFRVRADETTDGGVVQVARSLAEADATVAAIRNRLWALGAVVSLVAAALGWLVAGWVSRPLEHLTGLADHIAKTTDLDVVQTPAGSGTTRFEVGRLSNSFAAMLDALRSSREQQQQLVADAGHEMRTPLTTVRANAELLQSGRLSEEDRARSLGAIVSEIDELTTLTNELVELSMVNGTGESPREVDLLDIAAAAAERARTRHGREIVVAGDSCAVEGQPTGLDRAVSNLIDNAVKFSPPDSSIRVCVEPGRVSVRDLGPGIVDDDREHVFERFYRSDTARTLPGSGLGLAIVAKVAADHGGVAFVDEPDDGVGAIVGFTVAT